MRVLIVLMDYLPQHLISRAMGWFFSIEFPQFVNQLLIQLFIFRYGVDPSEAEFPLSQYKSIQDFFTRKLKSGSRVFQGLVSMPADGQLAHSLPGKNGQAVQYKNKKYSLSELVQGSDQSSDLALAWFFCVYLSPKNYHRVHSPIAGTLEKIEAFPGGLYPVNSDYGAIRDHIFSRNERMVFHIRTGFGGMIYVVMIGALNVGKIRSFHFPDFLTNQSGYRGVRQRCASISLHQGEQLGTFCLGSTVVVVLDRNAAMTINPSEIRDVQMVSLGNELPTKARPL